MGQKRTFADVSGRPGSVLRMPRTGALRQDPDVPCDLPVSLVWASHRGIEPLDEHVADDPVKVIDRARFRQADHDRLRLGLVFGPRIRPCSTEVDSNRIVSKEESSDCLNERRLTWDGFSTSPLSCPHLQLDATPPEAQRAAGYLVGPQSSLRTLATGGTLILPDQRPEAGKAIANLLVYEIPRELR